MDEDTESVVHFELENRFYYLFIKWPDEPVPSNMWRDREEKLHYLSAMTLDHLKASIGRVEKGLKEFIQSRGHPRRETEIVSILAPMVRAKLEEMKTAFREKADI
jgi:hypothetical protein